MQTTVNKGFSFDEFEIDVNKRLLLKNGKSVNLKPKAFDLLLVLVENHGKILSKNELLDTVWENQFVEENNLTVHISALRKILGEKKDEHRFIVTVPGRGYSFVAASEHIEIVNSGKNQHSSANPSNDISDAETIIGREKEIAEVRRLLLEEAIRLISLTGAGGSGKTRLAQAVASKLTNDFADGVYFVELSAVTNPEFVITAIANTLGVKESGDKSLIDVLKNFLGERQIFLVLDNFEQILSAAPLLEEILETSSFLKILVTSRALLHLNFEREFIVTPLDLPPSDSCFSIGELREFPAIELFVVRAKTAKPSFNLSEENARAINEICRKLDGLPLAIELAAARIKLLAPHSILERLENSLKLLTGGAKDLPARQQTMRETIRWSYDLLGADEKYVFRQLAVFAGGFTVEAAENIIKNETGNRLLVSDSETETAENRISVPQDNVLDLLTSLVENNLLSVKEKETGEVRLQLLEVVREFAVECLEQKGEAEFARQNHTQYFLKLAEESAPFLVGADSVKWIARLEEEHDNLRAALGWLVNKNPVKAARLAAALWFFWNLRSHLTEGRIWLKTVLKEASIEIPANIRLKLLRASAGFTQLQGDLETARRIYEEYAAFASAENDLPHIATAIQGLGMVAYLQGDLENARSLFEKGLEINRTAGDRSGIAASLNYLGNLTRTERDFGAARRLFEEALTLSRELGNKEAITSNLNNLGAIAFAFRDFSASRDFFAEGLEIAREIGNKTAVACALDGFAAIASLTENKKQAAQLAGAAEGLRENIGYEIELAERHFCDEYVTIIRTALDGNSFTAAYQKGQTFSLNEAVALAEILFSEQNEQTFEVIVEKHKIKRIVVEEEI